jgi:hypothetical protein
MHPRVPQFVSWLSSLTLPLLALHGEPNASHALVAEEVHAGKTLSLIALPPLGALLWSLTTPALSMARIPLGLVSILALAVWVMAWSGFRYRFTSSGVEIRTLGFHLRTIPVDQIKDYAADRWSLAGGYGIRGLGERRAYVWGNQGVRIKTTVGEVFLGHNDPARIIRDLDAIRKMPREKEF